MRASSAPIPGLRARRLAWGALLARVWGPNVLRCIRCGGEVALLAFVDDAQVVRAILAHLGLPTEAPRVASARGPPPDDGDFAQDTRGWELDFNQDPGHDAPA